MRLAVGFPRLALLVPAALLCAGCTSVSPTPSPVLHQPYFLSRDGVMRYRLPAGWFDATAESQGTDRAVFLVRGDYSGTLTVHEVHVDAAARRDLPRVGLLQIARLTAALESGSALGIVVSEPETVRMNGREGCAYEVEYPAGDRVRTVLVYTGERLYAVAALVNSRVPAVAMKDIYAVQQAFVAALRW